MMIKTDKYEVKLSTQELCVLVRMLQWYVTTRDDYMHISEMACMERACKLASKLTDKLMRYIEGHRKISFNLQEAATIVAVLDALSDVALGPREVSVRYMLYAAITQ